MLQKDTWLLPEGIEEVLPEQAQGLERLRRSLLDMFSVWGYDLVIPPMIDYLDSLLTGTGHDLDLQTFKLTDQLSGRMLGVRADMTPQVARIDARHLGTDCPSRLCYVGTTLHTRGEGLEKTRIPMQIGAELYGHAGIESDLEIISLMLEMLAVAQLQSVHLDLGHVEIYRALCLRAELDINQEALLFDILQRKDKTELHELCSSFKIDDSLRQAFTKLPLLNGGLDVLNTAREVLPKDMPPIDQALLDLDYLFAALRKSLPNLSISFDLAELRGYHYHTGVVFAAFIDKVGREIARGGRYDNIGEVFGKSRPATGFSADLKVLSSLSKQQAHQVSERICAPWESDPGLSEKIRDLRAEGRVVLQLLPGQKPTDTNHPFTSILRKENQSWVVSTL